MRRGAPPRRRGGVRTDTRRSYESWIKLHIIPKWGQCELSQLQARPVELWLGSLSLSPKSKAHIRGLLSTIWDYAMWRGDTTNVNSNLGFLGVTFQAGINY